MLASVNKLPCVFIRSSTNHPISITPLERAQCKQGTFHSSTNFWLLHQTCASVSSTCCPINLNSNYRTAETNQNPSNPVSRHGPRANNPGTLLSKIAKFGFPIAAFGQITFSTCVTAWPIVLGMLQEHFVRFIPSACLSLTFHQFRSHSDSNHFVQFFTGRTNPENFVRVSDRHLIALHPATSGFMSSRHKRTQHLCHPILVHFCCTEESQIWIVLTTSLLLCI